MPLIKKFNESTVSANVGLNGLDVQGATAIDSHISIMGNASFSTNRKDSVAANHHQHMMAEIGVGHFGHLTLESSYEIFAGYGRGYYQAYDYLDVFGPNLTLIRGQFNRYFLQGNFGQTFGDIEIGGALKSSYFNIFEVKSQDRTVKQAYNSIYLEPAVFIRFAFQHIQITSQFVFSHDIGSRFQLTQQRLLFSFGVIYKFRRKY